MCALASFDVFDTLLTRAVGSPHSLFVLMGRLDAVRRISCCSPEEFARVRIVSERRSRLGRPEVTLDEIYRELATAWSLSPSDVTILRDTELELERRLSRLVPGADRLVTEESATRRIAMSDMYLPGSFVAELLDRHDLLTHLDAVYVSCEHRTSKSTGGLYRAVSAREERPIKDNWHHVGDNAGSDHRVPRLLGLRATHRGAASLNRYERIWDRHCYATQGFSSLMAGAARLARLSARMPPGFDPVGEVAAGVAAPLLSAYVLWCLHSAQREGIRRLYFLARDGEILHLLAEKLAAKLGLDIDLRYLYGSRSVYHRASLATHPVAEAKWAWSAMYRLTLREVLVRLGLDAEATAGVLARLGLDGDQRATDDLVGRIVRDEATADLVRTAAQGLLDRLQGYLRQAGLSDGLPYAVVDTGWAGRVVQSLSAVLPPDATPLRRAYLFGYMRRKGGYEAPEILRGYLFDEYAETGYANHFNDAYGPLETFAVADHGMTTDFREGPDGIEPVLAGQHNPALKAWPHKEFRQVLFDFVDSLVLDPDIARAHADLRTPVAETLHEFWARPTLPEARAWSRFVYEDDILASSHNQLAVRITLGDFVGKAGSSYEGKRMWMHGSVRLSPPWLRPAARAGLWLNEVRRNDKTLADLIPPRLRSRAGLLATALRTRAKR